MTTVTDNNAPVLRLHHHGLAVREFRPALSLYEALGYACSPVVIDRGQNVELILCWPPTGPGVELIRPVDAMSPVGGMLQDRNEMLYHVCYEVSDFTAAVVWVRSISRITCIKEPLPAPLFDGRRVAFYHIAGIGIVELLEAEICRQ